MQTMILRVVKCGECFTVKSEKSEGGVLNKRTLVLQELGGIRSHGLGHILECIVLGYV